ncbi:uncharacterized protein LOC144106822 [Amblyomma americanum]
MTTSTRSIGYNLSGFHELLSWCTIYFKETLPKTKVCRLCGVVPSLVFLLPCRHGVCDFCKTLALKGTPKCPIDGERFKETDVLKLECSLGDLTERDVYCPNNTGSRAGCAFSGKLLDLSKHLSEDCVHAQVHCPQCGEGFARRNIMNHHSRCEAARSPSASTSTRGGSSQQQGGEGRKRPGPYERPFGYNSRPGEVRRPLGSERKEQSKGAECEPQQHFSFPEHAEPLVARNPPPMEPERTADSACNTNHETKFVDCVKGVVYRIPMTCGRHYVGQTGGCLNERLRQHRCSLGTVRGNLAKHCSQCGCQPLFNITAILEFSQVEAVRLRMEAEYIHEDREMCISEFSNLLHRGNQ